MVLLLFSIAPILLFLFLLLVKKASLLRSALVTLALVVLTTVFYWQIVPAYILIAVIKGFLVALDILIIILGAVFFLEILTEIKVIENICYYLETFSRDIRIQVILLAWFLENFIEGTAGFGTPSAVVAPLLVGLGLSPVVAVAMSLLGNSTSVAFGAAGTPIRVGLAGLDVAGVPFYTALFNSIGFLVPVFMLWLLALSRDKEKKTFFLEGLPFAVWCGIAFIVPSILILPLGQEFPSILGSVLGLALVLVTIKLKLLVPVRLRELQDDYIPQHTLPLPQVIFPYALLIALLLVGKFALGGVSIPFVLWSTHYTFNVFNPGFAFILASLPVAFLGGRKKLIVSSLSVAAKRVLEPFVVILAMSILVQLLVGSSQNLSGIPSALEYLASSIKTPLLPFMAPFIGAFGSFLTGSATISNIMFGNFLALAAEAIHTRVAIILALELVGAAAGNMIALADMLSAQVVVGLKNQERQVLAKVILPCAIYVTLVGLVGLVVAGV